MLWARRAIIERSWRIEVASPISLAIAVPPADTPRAAGRSGGCCIAKLVDRAHLPDEFVTEIETDTVRQPHVGERERVPIAAQQVAGLFERLGGIDVEAEAHQRERQKLAQIRFVVDHEDCRRPTHAWLGRTPFHSCS